MIDRGGPERDDAPQAPRECGERGPCAASGRVASLDCLRGVAALWVVLYHFTESYPQEYGDRITDVVVRNGPYAVYLFFMISGFVILRTFDRRNGIGDFALARFARLYPAYWACVILSFAVASTVPWFHHKVGVADFLANLTMAQRLLGFDHVDDVYWSLQVELAFYGATAAIVWAGFRRRLTFVLAAWVAANVALRVSGRAEDLHAGRAVLLIDYLYMFLFGIALHEVRGRWRVRDAAVVLVCVVDASVGRSAEYVQIVLPLMLAMAAAVRLPARLFGAPVTSSLGTISYSVYLVHVPVGFLALHALRAWNFSGTTALVVAGITVVAAAVALHRLVESPLHDWILGHAPTRLRSFGLWRTGPPSRRRA